MVAGGDIRPAGMRAIPGRDRNAGVARDRPAGVAGHQAPGHWEGDLIFGKQGRSAMGTLAERVSRFLIPVPLADGHDADAVRDALSGAVKDLPGWMRKSLTWDQGSEMARHAALTLAARSSGVFRPCAFPWESGTNENTNGLIREYLPMGTEITSDPEYLWAAADSLNDRPRAIPGFRKPNEVFASAQPQQQVRLLDPLPPAGQQAPVHGFAERNVDGRFGVLERVVSCLPVPVILDPGSTGRQHGRNRSRVFNGIGHGEIGAERMTQQDPAVNLRIVAKLFQVGQGLTQIVGPALTGPGAARVG